MKYKNKRSNKQTKNKVQERKVKIYSEIGYSKAESN